LQAAVAYEKHNEHQASFRSRKLSPDEIARDTEVRRKVTGEFTPAHNAPFRSNPMPLPVSVQAFVDEMETFGNIARNG
jgi:hypothetical protein